MHLKAHVLGWLHHSSVNHSVVGSVVATSLDILFKIIYKYVHVCMHEYGYIIVFMCIHIYSIYYDTLENIENV